MPMPRAAHAVPLVCALAFAPLAMAAVDARVAAPASAPASPPWSGSPAAVASAVLAETPDAWAARIESAMSDDERWSLLTGTMVLPVPGLSFPLPEGVPFTAGWVPGVARLGVPPQVATDASLGVANPLQLRDGDVATAMPSALALAASFDAALAERVGATIGAEARAKGFNVLLGGGMNLARDPRNGRNFEYLGEDPLLAGRLAGAAIRGTQSQGVVSTIKHYALNAQETQRLSADAIIAEPALRESELLAFQMGIETGAPGAVMCAYNAVNGVPACASDFLLNRVLKGDWRYPGWVMSDWGAVNGPDAFARGLDQQSASQLGERAWFGAPLREQVAAGEIPRARVADAVRRILRSLRAVGADRPAAPAPIDYAAHAEVALDAARAGLVLLRNDGVLPLAAGPRRVLVVGANADFGVLSGGGSSQVTPSNGAPRIVPIGGDGPMAPYARMLLMPSSPLRELAAALPEAEIGFDPGYAPAAAVAKAERADLVIVYASKWEAEGYDSGSLELPQGQDELIRRLAAANRNVVVVLQTGNPVSMPWLACVRAVLQAWYPGQEGGRAIAEVLTGRVNPSGRLPLTFPASLAQYPRERLPGFGQPDGTPVRVEYAEGADAGYRGYAKSGARPLFPFGHGLSYTRFEHSTPVVVAGAGGRRAAPVTLRFTVRNVGERAGADVPQLYLIARDGVLLQRLVGFERVSLAPDERRHLTMRIDDRLLADFRDGRWLRPAGRYRFAVGFSAAELGPAVELALAERTRPP